LLTQDLYQVIHWDRIGIKCRDAGLEFPAVLTGRHYLDMIYPDSAGRAYCMLGMVQEIAALDLPAEDPPSETV
jgi:hypothetical protein